MSTGSSTGAGGSSASEPQAALAVSGAPTPRAASSSEPREAGAATPARTAPSLAPAAPAPARRRGIDRMNEAVTGLLAVSIGAVLFAAAPSVLQGLGLVPSQTRAKVAVAAPAAPRGLPGLGRTLFEDDEDDEVLDDLQRLYPEPGNFPRIPSLGGRDDARVQSGRGVDDGVRVGHDDARLGLTRSRLTIREQPETRASALGEVKEGELVMIVKELGDWVLVVHPEDVLMGWTRKSGIAIR